MATLLSVGFVASLSASGCDRRGLIPAYELPFAPTGPFSGAAPANIRTVGGGYSITPDRTAFAVSITWDTVPGALTYVIDVGNAPGASNLSTTEIGAIDAGSFLVRLPHVGPVYARVKAKAGVSVGQSSAELVLVSSDFRDFTEALFFGTGALGLDQGTTCPAPTGDLMRGWPRGTSVRVLLGSGLEAGQRTILQRFVTQFRDAASGVSVTLVDSPLVDPPPATDQVVFAAVPDDQVERSCGGQATNVCFTQLSFAPFQIRMLVKTRLTGHNLGQFAGWAFGLCGVASPGWSSQSGFQDIPAEFSQPDLQAIGAVYGAGFGNGTPRSAFVAANLIRR